MSKLITSWALLMVACSPPSGLSLEVVATDGVTTVEVLVAQACTDRCGSQAAPPAMSPLSAGLFVDEHRERWTAPVTDGVVGFRITNDADKTTLPLIVAVGYDANNTAIATGYLTDVDIRPDAGDHVRLRLASAAPLVDDSTQAPGSYRIVQWGTSERPSCVMLEHTSSDSAQRFAIGPMSDPDCDNVQPAAGTEECAPWVHLAPGIPGSIDTATCTQLTTLASGLKNCTALSVRCNEGAEIIGACEPLAEDYCLVQPLCECPTWDPACTSAVIGPSTAPTTMYLSCVVPFADSGAPCSSPTTFDNIDFATSLSPTTVCSSLGFNELSSTIGPFSSSASVNGGVLTVKSIDAPCKITLDWDGQQIMPSVPTLASFDLGTKHLVLPVAMTSIDNCAVTPTCSIQTYGNFESALECAGIMPVQPPTLCEADPSSGCEGPVCAGICCAAGEQCFNGTTCGCGTANVKCAGGMTCQLRTAPGTPAGCGDACCPIIPDGTSELCNF